MNKQSGFGLVGALVMLGILLIAGGTLAMTYVSNYNYGNAVEKQIQAEYTNNQNVLAQYSLKVGEIAQVTDMQRDDIATVFKDAMTGRYGDEGSKAMFQFLREDNPKISADVYTRLQQVMEAGRNEFRISQTKLIDLKRSYETSLGYLWKGFWLRTAGYPKINLDDYKIVTSEYANDAFESGVDKGIQLRTPKQ